MAAYICATNLGSFNLPSVHDRDFHPQQSIYYVDFACASVSRHDFLVMAHCEHSRAIEQVCEPKFGI
jgi:hypothetical protein